MSMDFSSIANSLSGGALIGIAVTLMLLFNGRVTGISGIVSASMTKPNQEGAWRYFFLSGLILGGFIMNLFRPEFFINLSNRSLPFVILAGLLVGYGTVMGSGCTSGHGVCGISRFSMRSFIATLTFMFFGFLSVQVFNILFGGF